MFSNDNNVETIAQLIEVLKHYIGLQSEYVKLDVIEKVVRLLTAIAIVTMLVLLVIISLIYFSFAAAYALSAWVGLPVAFCIRSSRSSDTRRIYPCITVGEIANPRQFMMRLPLVVSIERIASMSSVT